MRETRWIFASDDARAAHATRRSFVAYATTALGGTAPVDLSGAELVLGELIGNANRYAPGPVVVEAAWERAAVRITVSDTGAGFFEGTPARPHDPLAESGRGLYLVTALARDLRVTCPVDGGCSVSATIAIAADASARA